mgnify:CR=1 FL=1
MYESVRAGRPVEVEEVASLADSLGGGIGMDNKLSFALCRDHLDDIVLVTEEEIYHAMQVLFYEDRIVAEGACVVGIAALLSGKLSALPGPIGTIIRMASGRVRLSYCAASTRKTSSSGMPKRVATRLEKMPMSTRADPRPP